MVDALDPDFVEELTARITAEHERAAAERKRQQEQRGRASRSRSKHYGGGRYETVDVPVE